MCAVVACMDCTEGRSPQHGPQDCAADPEHGCRISVQCMAGMEQSPASRACNQDEVRAAPEEHACVQDMGCLVVAALQDGEGAADDGTVSFSHRVRGV